MKRFLSLLTVIAFVGITNVWALSESITAGNNSYSSTNGTNTWDQTSCTVVNAKANSSTDVSSSNPGRWYKSSTVTFTPKSGYTITKIVLNGSSNSYHGQTMSASTGSCSKSSNTTTWTGSVAPSSYVTLTMGSQFRFGSVTIYYCCQPTLLENTTVNATSARLSWTDSHNINSYEVYRSTTNSAPAVNATPTTTVTTKYVDFSNLTANTTYYWWVRAKCANDCKSAWVAGTSFTTPAAAACTATPTVGAVSLNGSFFVTHFLNHDFIVSISIHSRSIIGPLSRDKIFHHIIMSMFICEFLSAPPTIFLILLRNLQTRRGTSFPLLYSAILRLL